MDNKFDSQEQGAGREWVVVDEVDGPLKAEMLRGLLEAQGLTVNISMEGVGRVHGLFVGPLAINQVLVPDSQVELASQILRDYYAGEYEQVEMEDEAAAPDDMGVDSELDESGE